jgi:hypothetical protein
VQLRLSIFFILRMIFEIVGPSQRLDRQSLSERRSWVISTSHSRSGVRQYSQCVTLRTICPHHLPLEKHSALSNGNGDRSRRSLNTPRHSGPDPVSQVDQLRLSKRYGNPSYLQIFSVSHRGCRRPFGPTEEGLHDRRLYMRGACHSGKKRMIDFSKLGKPKGHSKVANFGELFDQLDRKATHNSLRPVQIEALAALDTHVNERDVVLKVSTGSGKTLVGLIYAEYMRRRYPDEPTLYLCPTKQLADQVVDGASSIGVEAETFETDSSGARGLQGKAVLVCIYDNSSTPEISLPSVTSTVDDRSRRRPRWRRPSSAEIHGAPSRRDIPTHSGNIPAPVRDERSVAVCPCLRKIVARTSRIYRPLGVGRPARGKLLDETLMS